MPQDISPQATTGALTIPAGTASRQSAVLDLLGYPWWMGSWNSVGSGSTAIGVEYSSNGTTWNAPNNLNLDYYDPTLQRWAVRSQSGIGAASAIGVVLHSPVYGRYLRLSCSSTTTGTYTLQVTGLTSPHIHSQFVGPGIVRGNFNPVDATDDTGGDWLRTAGAQMIYQPGSGGVPAWHKLRSPNFFRTSGVNAAGNATVWVPNGNRRFRLMRYKMTWTGDCAVSSGKYSTVVFAEAGASIGIQESCYLPLTNPVNFFGGFTTGWVDLGNGYLATAANAALGVNLNVALSVGFCQVAVAGTEE